MDNTELLQLMNDTTFFKYYNQFSILALNLFKWENLPPTIESRHIEKALFEKGTAFFFEHPTFEKLCLPCGLVGFNVYDDPTDIIISNIFIHEQYKVKDGILIRNNAYGTSLQPIVLNYVSRLVEIEKTINQNIYLQKTPYILPTSKKQQLSVRKLYENMVEGEPLIMIDGDSDIRELKPVDLKVDFIAPQLMQLKKEIENEFLTFIGLNNNPESKKERMLVDEVNVNNEYINRNIDVMFNEREKACKEINKKYGLNIKVIRQSNIAEEIEENNKESEENEQEDNSGIKTSK